MKGGAMDTAGHAVPANPPLGGLVVREFEDALAPAFHDINAEWIGAMFRLEPTDLEVLRAPVFCRAQARGLKAGEFLLHAMIARAQALGADPLYLLTNRACAAAIHLYEKCGFAHDAGVMAAYGARYARCDVAMLHRSAPPA